MKLQLPHFRGGFGVTPNAGSAISAFFAASGALVQWLGFCSHPEQNFIDLASTWAQGQDLANPDPWPAPILLALKQAHQVLLTDMVVMNGLSMGQLFRKSRVRAQILLRTLRSLHLRRRQRRPTFDSSSPHPALHLANSRFKFGWQR